MQPSRRCDSCTGVPRCLANSTCLNMKNVKIHFILLQRGLQTSCSVGRQMGMCLLICMMPAFKKAVPGPPCASYCTNGTKDSPKGQTNCRARSNSYPSPMSKGCVAAHQPAGWAAGLPSGPAALVPKVGHEGRLERGEMK